MRKPLNKNFFAGIAYMLFLSFGLNAQNCIMNCKDTAIIVLDNNCQAIVNSDQIYINPQDCPGPGTVHIYNYLGIDLGNIVDGTYMDSILHIIITGYAGTQYSCTSKLIIKDITGPMIECKDTLISCMENNKPDPKLPSFLLIHDNCSIIDTAYYADQVYNFSCKNNGVNTYFADNWIIDTSCAGIGKVLFNINQFVLIGAGDTINPPKGNCSTTMTIKIPVDGKISFDWLVKGHADKDMEALYCKINNVLWKLSSKDTLMGTFNSPDLFIGDELSIELFSDGDSVFNTAYISGFEFTTKITELIIRTWTAIDKKGNSSSKIQKISIESIDLNLVSFPTDYDGVANNKISCSGDYSISATGQPKYAYPLNVNSGKLSILKSNNCVNVEYVDKKDSICGGSFKLTRSWRITDKCKSTLLTHDQIIIVEDLQAPVISAPYELIYSTDADKCSGKVIIPPVTATDQCSPKNINVSINTSFGTNGYGPFPNVPIGDHLVFYTATDECGNSAQASSKITVKDKTTPIAIVKSNLIYYLPLSGQLKIYAKDIDMGSTDNCCIQGFKIKRVNEPVSLFKDELILNCSDCNANGVTLTFRVYDCYTNYKDINTNVLLKDNIVPTAICPKDITISCTQDVTNLNLYGKINYIDNCQDLVQYAENKMLNKCGEGIITRYWTVVDKSANSIACSQKITVLHNQYWNQAGNEITWPIDYNTTDCKNLNDLNSSALPVVVKQPVLTGNTACSNISVDYTDKLISNNSTGCISIERNWTIIEYCLYESTKTKEGSWTHKQILSINEKQGPVLTVPKDITIETQFGDCFAMVNLSQASAIDCDPDPIITNSINGAGGDISGKYQTGVNLVNITATDHCGNSSSAIIKISVKDAQAPTALCKQNVSIDLAGITIIGYKSLTADLINNNSIDNCTAANQLNLSIIPDKITCADIGTKMVILKITDKSNNISTCSTNINITDITGACAAPSYKISGIIKTETNKTVAKVSCNISGSLNSQKTSGTDGLYSFDQLNKNAGYTIEPKKTLSYLNGVTTYDLILLNDHIQGKKSLDSPYKYIAADVNNNKKVSLADYAIIKDLILLNINEFPNTDSWRFIPTSFKFPVYHPVLPMFPEKLDFNNLQNNVNDADFIAVKMGDLNNSNNPSNKINPVIRSIGQTELIIQDYIVNKGDEFCLPITMNGMQNIKGFQFSLNLNPNLSNDIRISLQENGIIKHSDIGDHIADSNELLLSWINDNEQDKIINDTLLSICGTAHISFRTSDLIKRRNDEFSPEVYNSNYETSTLNIQWQEQSNNNQIAVNASPNPFNDYIQIRIKSNDTEDIEIMLYNSIGQLIKTKHESISKGIQNIVFNIEDKLENGLYILNINAKDKVISKKMIMFTPYR